MNERRSLVVILSALDVEYRAVRERLVTVHRLDSVAGTLFETGTLYAGGDVVLALTGEGNHPAAVIAERAISTFSPIAILFAGVASALTPDLNLGDIVVATRVYGYRGAADGGGPMARPRVWEIDHRIELAAHRVNRRFDQVRFGPVASGEVVRDAQDSPERRWVGEHYEDPLTIDMEAAGVAQAGQFRGVPIGVIRAISDRAHGVRPETDVTGREIRDVDVTSGTGGTSHGSRGVTSEASGGRHGLRGVTSEAAATGHEAHGVTSETDAGKAGARGVTSETDATKGGAGGTASVSGGVEGGAGGAASVSGGVEGGAGGAGSVTGGAEGVARGTGSAADRGEGGSRGTSSRSNRGESGARGDESGIEGRRSQAEAARRAAGFAAALAADLIARPPSLGRGSGQGSRAAVGEVGEAREAPGPPAADVDVEARGGRQEGRHGAVAGNGNGDVRDDGRLS